MLIAQCLRGNDDTTQPGMSSLSERNGVLGYFLCCWTEFFFDKASEVGLTTKGTSTTQKNKTAEFPEDAEPLLLIDIFFLRHLFQQLQSEKKCTFDRTTSILQEQQQALRFGRRFW